MPETTAEKPHYHGHRRRLRERFLADGGAGFQDYELLEFLLTLAIPRRDTKELAKSLLDRFRSFAEVIAATPEALAEFGLSETSIAAIKIVDAAAIRLSQRKAIDQPVLSSWQKVLDYCHAAMARSPTEHFRILFLDRKNKLIRDEVQQTGTVNHAPVYPREVMKRALELGASAIIMVHDKSFFRKSARIGIFRARKNGMPAVVLAVSVDMEKRSRDFTANHANGKATDRRRPRAEWGR